MNEIFIHLWRNASHQKGGVCRTLSNLTQNFLIAKTVDLFCIKVHLRCLTGFSVRVCERPILHAGFHFIKKWLTKFSTITNKTNVFLWMFIATTRIVRSTTGNLKLTELGWNDSYKYKRSSVFQKLH